MPECGVRDRGDPHGLGAAGAGARDDGLDDQRDRARHGHPIRLPEPLSGLEGTAYLPRASVDSPAGIRRTKKALRAALETQRRGLGFALVEILTMCPTGWFVDAPEGPAFQRDRILPSFPPGEIKRPATLPR